MTTYQGTVVTSAMFVTAIAVNPLVVGLAKSAGVEISWSTWALGALVPGVLSLLAIPYVVYLLYPPEIRATPAAAEMAAAGAARMGPMEARRANHAGRVRPHARALVVLVAGRGQARPRRWWASSCCW